VFFFFFLEKIKKLYLHFLFPKEIFF